MVAVNIAIELMGFVISLVLFLSLYINGDVKTREGRLYGWILALQMLVLATDAVSWALVGRQGMWAGTVVHWMNFIAFTAGVVAQAFFVEYLHACILQKRHMPRTHSHVVVFVLCGLLEMFIIVSQGNGMVYFVDADNLFHTGYAYWLFSLLFSAIYLYIAAVAVHYRKTLGTKETLVFVTFGSIMLIAHWIEYFNSDIMFSYVASTVATLIVYVNIQAKKRERMELEMTQARIATMLSQIQPHFLFNALTAIERLCVKAPQEAQVAVAQFSKYLRGNLNSLSMQGPISFARELEHAKVYLALEEKRFGPRLRVVYDIRAQDFLLPALTLQMLVENAVQHGVTQQVHGGTVKIRSEMNEKQWCVTIEDDGVGFDAASLDDKAMKSMGTENIRSRLASMCGGHLTMHSIQGVGTTVRVYIPKEESTHAHHSGR